MVNSLNRSIFIALIGMSVTAQGQTLSFESNVKFKKLEDSSLSELPANEKLTLKAGEPYLILTQQSLPLLIFSATSSSSQLKISEPNLSLALREQLLSQLNLSLNEVLDGIRKAETQMQKRDYSSALNLVTELKNKFPKVSNVLFLSGTLHYLNKNKSSAIEDLEAGLAIDSNNAAARKLLSELKGGSP